ncbi:MAG: ankyrin repeat domain-containing protein [Elusimicrobiales bacterium]
MTRANPGKEKRNAALLGGLLCLSAFSAACALRADPAERLTAAVRAGDVAGVRAALASGASANEGGDGSWTPLMMAVMQDDIEITDILLDNKADVYARNKALQTPLHLAARWGKERSMARLIKRGLSMELRDELGWTPLMWAAMRGKAGAAEQLLKAGALPNPVDSDGNTALILAAWRGHSAVASLLLAHGADLHARTRDGLDAAAVAEKNRFPKVAAMLRGYKPAGKSVRKPA